jgi:hypothetical protein
MRAHVLGTEGAAIQTACIAVEGLRLSNWTWRSVCGQFPKFRSLDLAGHSSARSKGVSMPTMFDTCDLHNIELMQLRRTGVYNNLEQTPGVTSEAAPF